MNNEQITHYMLTKKYIKDEYLCWDFVRDVIKDILNIELPEYPLSEVPTKFKKTLTSNLRHIRIEPADAQEGDLIVFSMFDQQHAGVMINNECFIHLPEEGVLVSDLDDAGGNYVIYRLLG